MLSITTCISYCSYFLNALTWVDWGTSWSCLHYRDASYKWYDVCDGLIGTHWDCTIEVVNDCWISPIGIDKLAASHVSVWPNISPIKSEKKIKLGQHVHCDDGCWPCLVTSRGPLSSVPLTKSRWGDMSALSPIVLKCHFQPMLSFVAFTDFWSGDREIEQQLWLPGSHG